MAARWKPARERRVRAPRDRRQARRPRAAAGSRGRRGEGDLRGGPLGDQTRLAEPQRDAQADRWRGVQGADRAQSEHDAQAAGASRSAEVMTDRSAATETLAAAI